MPMKLAGYVRVSTDEQADGLSLETQEARLRAYCMAHGHKMVSLYTDVISGKSAPRSRPGFGAALAAVDGDEADGVVALRLDRFSRSTRDTLQLAEAAQKSGWHLVSVNEMLDTSSAQGRFTLTILAALAQLEREQVSERTKVALNHLAREGRVRSRYMPFGFRMHGLPDAIDVASVPKAKRTKLVVHAGETALLERIMELTHGGIGAVLIARNLNRDTVNPRTGNSWTAGTVASIVKTARRRERLT